MLHQFEKCLVQTLAVPWILLLLRLVSFNVPEHLQSLVCLPEHFKCLFSVLLGGVGMELAVMSGF